MRPWLLLPALLFLAAPAAAQEPPDWRNAREYDVLMLPFDYEPQSIRLAAGEPVRLRFINNGQSTFSFSAEPFFRASRLRPGDGELVADGKVEVGPGEQRIVVLVPAAGRYRARSSNLLHRLLGMSAEIIVE